MNRFKRIYLKYRLNFVSGLTLLLAFVAVLSIYFSLEVRLQSNDECLWNPQKVSKDSVEIFFSKVKENGVSWNAGIRNGDQLLEIDDVKLSGTLQAQEILNKFKSGELADYVVKKPTGEILRTQVFVKKLVQFGSLAQSISALLYLIIGFIVFTAKPDGLAQRLFYLIGVFTVLAAAIVLFPLDDLFFMKFIIEKPKTALIAGSVVIFSQVFVQFLVLYFVWSFPMQFKFASKKSVKIALIAASIILSLTGIILASSLYWTNFKSLSLFRSWQLFIRITFLIIYIASWFSLLIQYKREKNPIKKKPILLFIIAFTFGSLIQLYVSTIAPAISDTVFNSPEYYMPIILVVFVPIIFAYAIFKYHLLDVSIVVRNTIIYGTAMATIAGIYFVVIYLLGQGISRVIGAENQGLIAGIFFLIFAFIFQSTKDRFQGFLTRKFYPEQFAYQKVLIQFSNDVSTVVGTDRILDLTTSTFIDALKINKFGILIRDYDEDVLTLARGVGFANQSCHIEKSNLITVFRTKSLVSNYPVIEQQDFESVFPGKAERLIEEGIYSIIPMIVKSKVIGALLFGLKYSGSKFGGKDLELLTAAANQLAISLENARLYKTELEKIKIERDLDLAKKIQQGLLPKHIPYINGLDISGEMIPAMQVGGDYYDLIPLSETKIFVAVADVSGKGLSASLYMTKLQTMIQLASQSSSSPKEILIEINKRLYQSMERSWFITMTLALFDTENNTIKFCRAGHMPLITANNGTVESIKTEGIGLGLEKGEVFERTLQEVELKTKSNQIFAFFSDGITEAMNENDELFGEDKLNEILKGKSHNRSTEVMDKVWSEVQLFRGSTPVNDDMTMVIVKVK
ncbi:MAG: SpoIIE family protein phosphatase [Ignavibacteriales bacterium]|nr:SpoIIE family protein phosphatase [Ignavibacteriales bacterium]